MCYPNHSEKSQIRQVSEIAYLGTLLSSLPDELACQRRFRPSIGKKPYKGCLLHPAEWKDEKSGGGDLSLDTAARFLRVGCVIARKSKSEGRKDRPHDTSKAGIVYVLRAGDGVFCIDLDNCRCPATGDITTSLARQIINQFLGRTFIEVSSSGRGVHIWGIGTKPTKLCRVPGVEIYDHQHVILLTGRLLTPETPRTLWFCQDELDLLCDRLFPQRKTEPIAAPTTSCPADVDGLIQKIIGESKYSQEFLKLFRDGDLSSCLDERGRPDPSRGDWKLCRYFLAPFAGDNPDLIDRAFRRSAFYRPKWDRSDGYGPNTIRKAIDNCTWFYRWPKSECPGLAKGNEQEAHSQTGTPDVTLSSELCCRTVITVGKDENGKPIRKGVTEAISGMYRPEISHQYNPCRKAALFLYRRENPKDHKNDNYPCNCRGCYHCGQAWLDSNRDHFWGIVKQFTPIYTLTANESETEKIKKQIRRGEKKLPESAAQNVPLHVNVPLAGGQRIWFTNAAIEGAKETPQAEAWKLLMDAIGNMLDCEELKDKDIGRSQGLELKLRKQISTGKWAMVPQQGPQTLPGIERVSDEITLIDPDRRIVDLPEFNKTSIFYQDDESHSGTYAMLERLKPGYQRPGIKTVNIRPGTLVLNRRSDSEETSQNESELCSVLF